ncbi:hypothetical protein AAVH_15831 [Aphelenchoides avenae]|nr:hypothetical protein AAVH_15831 [Aphelenchus avenae]
MGQPHNQDTAAYAGNLKQLHNCELFDFPGDVHSQIQLYNVPRSNYACIELHRAQAEATGAHSILEF